MAGEEKMNHKGMDPSQQVIPPDVFYSRLRENRHVVYFNTRQAGGIVWDDNSRATAYVRGPMWRAHEGDPNIRPADMRELLPLNGEVPRYSECKTGQELELKVVDKQGRLVELFVPGSAVLYDLEHAVKNGIDLVHEEPFAETLSEQLRRLSYSEELLRAQIELNFAATSSLTEAATSTALALQKVAKILKKHGYYLAPISALAHHPLQREETNPNAYVQRMVDWMGWENINHFTGSSVQFHVEMGNMRHGLVAINMYQQVSAMLYAMSLSAPFADGYANPNLRDLYIRDETNVRRRNDRETYELLGSSNWLSVRNASRWRGSHSGGVYERAVPENPFEFFMQADEMLRSGEIPSPARVAGHHRDRPRPDIGTLEPSSEDTYGGNIHKITASRELNKAILWKLQYYVATNNMTDLAREVPQLFGYPVTEAHLRNAHLSHMKVGQSGVDAVVYGADGKMYRMGDLAAKLIAWAAQPVQDDGGQILFNGLHEGVRKELANSIKVPTQRDFAQAQDEQGITSMRGYYESGIGTAAHWMKQRMFELLKKGIPEAQAIEDCMRDLALSYTAHVMNFGIQDVARFF